MDSAGKYRDMVMYLDSCESGSMFADLLAPDIYGICTCIAMAIEILAIVILAKQI